MIIIIEWNPFLFTRGETVQELESRLQWVISGTAEARISNLLVDGWFDLLCHRFLHTTLQDLLQGNDWKEHDLNTHHGVSRIGMVKKAIEATEKPNLKNCTTIRFKDFHASYTSQLSSTTTCPSKKMMTRKSNNKVCAYM